MASRFPLFALLSLLLAAHAVAEEAEVEPYELPRGRMLWGLGASAGVSDGDRASGLGSALLRMDRVVSPPGGPGFLRGQLGYAFELVPLFLLSQGEVVYGAGFNLLGRHYFGRSGPVRPFATLGAGLIVSSMEVPAGTTQVNFTPQIGFGFLFSRESGPAYSLEVRLHHISNGGRVHPNPGINSVVAQLGVSFPSR